jgi:hypothetical protein
VLTGYTSLQAIQTQWCSYDAMNRLTKVSTGAYGQVQTGTVQTGVDESTNDPIYSPTAPATGPNNAASSRDNQKSTRQHGQRTRCFREPAQSIEHECLSARPKVFDCRTSIRCRLLSIPKYFHPLTLKDTMYRNSSALKNLMKFCLFVFCAVLAGCASGPAFKPVSSIPEGKALIYVYRPSVMHGAALVPYVVVNDSRALPLKNGGYYTYAATPGSVTVAVTHTGQRSVTLEVKAGETYYVKGGPVFMAFGVPYVERASAEVGLKELSECKLLPDTFSP